MHPKVARDLGVRWADEGDPLSQPRHRGDLGELYPQLYRALRLSGPDGWEASDDPARPDRGRCRAQIAAGRRRRLGGRAPMCALSTCSSTPAPTRSARSTRRAAPRCAPACERHGIRLGLHTSSAVNVAEYAPLCRRGGRSLSRSLCRCRRAARRRMDRRPCRVSLHLGPRPAHAGRARAAARGSPTMPSASGALILLENLNKEPEQAEVHYLAHTVEEWRFYFDAHPVAVLPAVVHRQPRASRARGHRRVCRRARFRAGSRGPPRRLLPQRLRGAPAAGRGRSRFRRHVPADRRSQGSAATT